MEVPSVEEEKQDVGDESPATSTSTTNTTNEDGNNDTNGDTDPRMVLTPVEKEWALEIKAAALLEPELDPMTDFMYAQFAIHSLRTAEDDGTDSPSIEGVLTRIENYQMYRKEHKIHDTYQDACQALDKTLRELLPYHYLSFSYHPSEDAYVIALESTSFDRSVMEDPLKHSTYVAGTHYTFHAQQPDFQSIRLGVVALYEMDGYNWRDPDMFNIKCVRSFADQTNVFPVRPRSARFYNTGMFTNMMLSLAKRIMRKTVTSTLEIGWKFNGGGSGPNSGTSHKLRDVLVTPDQETTTERNLIRLKMALEKRYKNEKTFQLC